MNKKVLISLFLVLFVLGCKTPYQQLQEQGKVQEEVTSEEPAQVSAEEEAVEPMPSSQTLEKQETVLEYCLRKWRTEADTVFFIYSDRDPHSTKMKNVVYNLEREGNNFYWANSADTTAKAIINDCLKDMLSGFVPQFICPKTGKDYNGEMSESDLRNFAIDCQGVK